jgi:hypothetical protein
MRDIAAALEERGIPTARGANGLSRHQEELASTKMPRSTFTGYTAIYILPILSSSHELPSDEVPQPKSSSRLGRARPSQPQG